MLYSVHISNCGDIISVVGTYLYTQAGTTSDGDDPKMYDLTYQNNLGSYVDKVGNTMSVLYDGSAGKQLRFNNI